MAAKKMGRPTDNPKDITMKIRFDQDSFEKMEKCSEEMRYPEPRLLDVLSIRCMTTSKNKRSGAYPSK